MNAHENVNVEEGHNEEVVQTLRNYFKIYENANVQNSTALRIQVITELFEYILGDINCRMYLLDPAKNKLFTMLEKKLAELMSNPKAQANNRFMAVCEELDVFLQNGRILKAEQAAQALPPVPIVMNYADLHAEDEYEYEDEDEYEEGAPPLEFNRNIMENYIISIFNVEDDETKVTIAFELFEWICENQLIRQALFAPENKDLFDDLYWALEEIAYAPVYFAAVEANDYYRILDREIKTIVEHLERVLSEREDEAQ
jgi:hypothetical protein